MPEKRNRWKRPENCATIGFVADFCITARVKTVEKVFAGENNLNDYKTKIYPSNDRKI